MREIIQAQIGACGNQIGSTFLQVISEEHGIDQAGQFVGNSDLLLERAGVYFNELEKEKFIPRAVRGIQLNAYSLFDISQKSLKIIKPTYGDLNHIISLVMSGITCSFRFPGQLNQDFRKLATNLIPFPRLHFLLSSVAPINSRATLEYIPLNQNELIYQMMRQHNMMCSINPKQGKCMTGAAMFRGKLSMYEIETQMHTITNKQSIKYTEWIPDNIKISSCSVPPKGLQMSSTFLGNSSSIQSVFKAIYQQFTAIFQRKSFLHWYFCEGMDELEFTEAQSSMNDLVYEYQIWEGDYYGDFQ